MREVTYMSAFNKIIGYSQIKRELRQISDILRNKDVYENLGVTTPSGLLLYGEPGVGKSLMASAVIEESGRKVFPCRKDRPNGDFVKEIKTTFDNAVANAPSIVYLDDLDKFTNGDERHPDAEEYVTVQTCIDAVKGREVFVLATANNIRCLPTSLRRAGRFDRKIEVRAPHGEDAEKIIAHYLRNKKFVDEVDARTIARIMDGRSCAELETVINEAGLYAGYERAGKITMEHFTEACLRTIFDVPAGRCYDEDDDDFDDDFDDYDEYDEYDDGSAGGEAKSVSERLSASDSLFSQIVYHEAGHVTVFEVLCPESVTLVSAHNRGGENGGFTNYYNDHSTLPLNWIRNRIVGALGGAAAVEQKFGIFDAGCEKDLDFAFSTAKDLVVNKCVCGFHLHQNMYEDSQELWSAQEKAVSAEVERYYRKAKEIISLNRDFLEKVAGTLAKKKLLSAVDIRKIKSECEIIPVTL